MSRKRSATTETGFTLLEITLAMAIFTFMLLIVSLAYINIARLYNASTAARNVQQNNRFVMEQMSRVARDAKAVTVNASATQICFSSSTSNQLFYLDSDKALHQVEGVASCSAGVSDPGTVLTSGDARVYKMAVDQSVPGTVSFTVWMVSKANLLESAAAGAEPTCKSGAGAEFCAVNKLTTTVELRGE